MTAFSNLRYAEEELTFRNTLTATAHSNISFNFPHQFDYQHLRTFEGKRYKPPTVFYILEYFSIPPWYTRARHFFVFEGPAANRYLRAVQ
jgi:hypothetical protein